MPDPYIDDGSEDDYLDEPIGSCENCGCDLFYYDDSEFCESCEWGISQ